MDRALMALRLLVALFAALAILAVFAWPLFLFGLATRFLDEGKLWLGIGVLAASVAGYILMIYAVRVWLRHTNAPPYKPGRADRFWATAAGLVGALIIIDGSFSHHLGEVVGGGLLLVLGATQLVRQARSRSA